MSIYRSIANRDADALAAAIASGEDVHKPAYGGNTHLHWAAERGFGEGIAMLVKEGADPNVVNDRGDSPLMKAIINRSPSATVELLKANANPETPNKRGATPLNWLVNMNASGSVTMTRIVVVDGVETEEPVDMSPQAEAARQTLQALLEGGANPNGTDNMGMGALACAAGSNHLDFARLLLAAGADPNHGTEAWMLPINCAREGGHEEMIALLIENGAAPSEGEQS